MKINTTRFGEIDITDDKIIHFKDGVPGFENCKRFALITTEETDPFLWLQAFEETDISLAVINPFRLFPDYAPSVSSELLNDIGAPQDEDILLLTVAVIPRDFTRMTTNLVSPILINAKENIGKQIILENSEYQIRQNIYDKVNALLNSGGGQDASTN